jgi:hypothetical protein
MTFSHIFWATIATGALFFLCLIAASASIGQLKTSWKSYAKGILFLAIAAGLIYEYHYYPNELIMGKECHIALTVAGIFLAAVYLREGWRGNWIT